MRKTAYILSIVIGLVLIIGAVATWILVSNTLSEQRITVRMMRHALLAMKLTGR